ncbi:rhodanese-like domain-containing protein [Sphingobacterium sp. SG20118]|uniref:MBL fold metallo-hydrolase n=1 Tax=Sphingobacterium sp. SG20118 TaxID=3367156 RepID=UPI0037DFC2D9
MKSFFKINTVIGLIVFGQSQAVKAQSLIFERVFDKTLAQTSYIIGNSLTREAIVIDPKRDIDTYLEIAQDKGLNITHVTETHIHADYLSGSRELAAATGAKLYLSDMGGKDWQYEFAHLPLKEGDKIELGSLALEVMHTPGHTPESLTFLLKDQSAPLTPIKAITGDFIFVGDVGRPDLLEKAAGQVGTQEASAKQLFASISRFMKLPDNTEIWPGHGAGSFCGKSLSSEPQSTLKQEKSSNHALQFLNNEAGFIDYILSDQPVPPKYFAMMKNLNKVHRPLLVEVPKHAKLSKIEADRAINNKLQIIDTRSKEIVASGFIPGSLHIEGGNSFSTFLGSLLDYDQQFILVAEEDKIEDLTRKLMRIGLDNIYGYISNVNGQSLALLKSDRVDLDKFETKIDSKDVQMVDVRTATEFKNGHIKGAENISFTSLTENMDKISRDKPVIIHCQSGARANIAYSILKKNGFNNILNYSGGINDWVEKGKELEKKIH